MNFAVHTGAVVPTSVHVVAISTFPILIETFPQYRDYSFFVVEDEIVFVDRGHKVVDVVPVGPRARFSRGSSGSSAVVAVDLSEPEIREVQQVLITRGFLHGRVTGVLEHRNPRSPDRLPAQGRLRGERQHRHADRHRARLVRQGEGPEFDLNPGVRLDDDHGAKPERHQWTEHERAEPAGSEPVHDRPGQERRAKAVRQAEQWAEPVHDRSGKQQQPAVRWQLDEQRLVVVLDVGLIRPEHHALVGEEQAVAETIG